MILLEEYGGENEILSKLELELTTGMGAYDVIHVFSQTIKRYLLAGWLSRLNDFIDNPKLTNKSLFISN